MIVATWNVRGMQQLPRQSTIFDFVRKHKIDVIGLLETKLKTKNYTFLMKNKFKECRNADNFNLSDRSRMLLLWNPSQVDLEIIQVDLQTIHTKIRCKTSNNTFFFTLVYDGHSISDRRPLSDSLIEYVPRDEPSLVSGDFNNVMGYNERVGENVPSEYEVKNMVDTCALLGLEDVMSTGCRFTRSEGGILSKIDRALVNDAWNTHNYIATTEFFPAKVYSCHDRS